MCSWVCESLCGVWCCEWHYRHSSGLHILRPFCLCAVLHLRALIYCQASQLAHASGGYLFRSSIFPHRVIRVFSQGLGSAHAASRTNSRGARFLRTCTQPVFLTTYQGSNVTSWRLTYPAEARRSWANVDPDKSMCHLLTLGIIIQLY